MNESHRPLAERMRPETLDDVVGQDHLVGDEGMLKKLIARDFLPSLIFWGPPGSGKTTMARLLADQTNAHFVSQSAVTAKLADVRAVIAEARERRTLEGKRTVLFIDEIHRFNKAQQDAFLPHVERGTIILIGATTENPSFEVISPLLSRSRVLVVNPLDEAHLTRIADRTLKAHKRTIGKKAKQFLIQLANGDARALLTTLEIAFTIAGNRKRLKLSDIEEAAQRKVLQYDQKGEEHYNTISAYIKSMRASDVDAALYYLGRMVEAGEDPLFIARRMVVFASEDIGLAQPTALVVANAVFEACHKIGYPEAQIPLAHGTAYMARAKKDRSAYDGYFAALDDVKKHGNLPIPMKIRNAPTKLMKNLGYGKGYKAYTDESLLPKKLKTKRYMRDES